MSKKVILVILDGWGKGKVAKSSAIENAHIPFVSNLFKTVPNAELVTYGKAVGLPEGQMGNSEVGHLNIGAGRVVYQELQRINVAIEDHSFEQNQSLLHTFEYCNQNDKTLHLMGLVSDGGIHSHINHLEALLQYAFDHGVKKVILHAFTDGRDTDPKSGMYFLQKIDEKCNALNYHLGSVCGRYYAMDRDKRWERVKLAYDLMVNGIGEQSNDLKSAIEKNYEKDITDEFIKPIVLPGFETIKSGDAVLCFNFRTDRCREITEVLHQQNFPEFGMKKLELYFVTMTNYSEDFVGVHALFEKDNLSMTLGEVLENQHKKQVRIAETEKYPHVTFFFSGGRENEFEGEKRIMVPSPKVATYDLQPEMSARGVTDSILKELKDNRPDFVCLNFANADMVGHTGVFSAAVKAVEFVDGCLEEIVDCGKKLGYGFVIIADHGNADYMINEDGTPNTAHSMNPVPFFVIDEGVKEVKDGKLGDMAPTILKMMELDIPVEMTGNVLI